MSRTITLDHETRIALYLLQVAYQYQLPEAPEAGEASIGAAIHLLRGHTLDETIAEVKKEIAVLHQRAIANGWDAGDEEDAVELYLREADGWRLDALNFTLDDLTIIKEHPERIATNDALTYKELEGKYA